MNREMQVKLVENLKLLNAKERDLLMRHAYLDIDDVDKPKFLSKSFDKRLKDLIAEKLNLRENPKCVFAGMDYHLDWLFAALYMTTQNRGPDDVRGELELHDDTQAPASKYTDFRSVTGTQEDIDLLVVYDVNDQLVLLFIEAKGSAAFDRVQLARKLIRLDRILVASEVAQGCKYPLRYLLVLASPRAPKFENRLTLVGKLRRQKNFAKLGAICAALEGLESGIGDDLHHLPLENPGTFYAVHREPERKGKGKSAQAPETDHGTDSGDHTHWRLKKRKSAAN